MWADGNLDSDVLFIGEAPGFHEDQQGRPFVGAAGQLLDKLLAEVGLDRTSVAIVNVLKCRPPGNRDPQPDEIEHCKPYLYRQVELIEPKVICTLGNFATKLLSGSQQGITRVHGRPQERTVGEREVVLYPLFHPAAALRTPSVHGELRHDFEQIPALLEEVRREPVAAAAPEPSQLGLFG